MSSCIAGNGLSSLPLHMEGLEQGNLLARGVGSVSKAPRERSLLLCSAPAACLRSLGRPPGLPWLGHLQGSENLRMQRRESYSSFNYQRMEQPASVRAP